MRFSPISIGMTAVVALIVVTTSAFAQQEVIESTAPAYKPGDRLNDDPIVSVPAGRVLKLRDRTRRSVYTILGAYAGPVSGWVWAMQAQNANKLQAPLSPSDSTRSYRKENYSSSPEGSQARSMQPSTSSADSDVVLQGGGVQARSMQPSTSSADSDVVLQGGGVAGNIEPLNERF